MADLPFGDVAHLLRRSGFAAHRSRIQQLQGLNWSQAVEAVIDPGGALPGPHDVPRVPKDRKSWDNYCDMVHFWTRRAATTHAPIVEKMTLFWHGTLPTSLVKVFHHQLVMNQNGLYRNKALGPLLDLYQSMAIDPAMLRYLDNDTNVAKAPNENWARELMELFLLGVGNYNETDVRAAAAAWSGHGLDDTKEHYRFHPANHATAATTFMGVHRVWNGPDIIHHLIEGPQKHLVSRFLAAKLWSFLAYPNPEPAVVDTIAAAMRAGGMRTDATLEAIFNHAQFRSVRAKRGLLRSPFEFMVAAMAHTQTPPEVAHPEWYGDAMGQAVFQPPNVSGWRQNEYWISVSSSWARQQFAAHLRWRLAEGSLLADTGQRSVADAATAALDLFGIYEPSAATRAAIEQFIRAERSAKGWGERAGLLMLPMLTPEFGLA